METTKKIIIYQVFTRLFGNQNKTCQPDGDLATNGCGKMKDFTKQALHEIKKLGATHIWYTGLLAHASQTDYTAYGIPKNHPSIVKGKAGSPYAIRDYYDVDPDLAEHVDKRMEEFEELVKRTHECGLKMIIDFVPNHVARQYHSIAKPQGVKDLGEEDDCTQAFNPQNNFYYIPGQKLGGEIDFHNPEMGTYEEMPAKATGNGRFDPWPNRNDWYETVKLNYGVDYINHTGGHFDPIPDTWHKMEQILSYWAEKGIDGFRCDMAEMVPCEFWGWVIPRIKAAYPHIIFIAEVYNPNEYRNYIHNGHFDYLYDKVGLYDTLRNITCGYASATGITHCWQSVDDIQDHMLNFLENHDEQRIASGFFAEDPFKAVPAFIVSACLRKNPVMVYFGQELGEKGMDCEGFSGRDGRTTIFDYWCVDSIFRWNNHGRWNTHLLNEREKELRHFYETVLHICQNEPAISDGDFFDLMYVNLNGWQMNEHKQYAFLRKFANEVLLIMVNFGDVPAQIRVNIPPHAFDYLKMTPSPKCRCKDLLSGKQETICFSPDSPVCTELPAYGGKILKLKVK